MPTKNLEKEKRLTLTMLLLSCPQLQKDLDINFRLSVPTTEEIKPKKKSKKVLFLLIKLNNCLHLVDEKNICLHIIVITAVFYVRKPPDRMSWHHQAAQHTKKCPLLQER